MWMFRTFQAIPTNMQTLSVRWSGDGDPPHHFLRHDRFPLCLSQLWHLDRHPKVSSFGYQHSLETSDIAFDPCHSTPVRSHASCAFPFSLLDNSTCFWGIGWRYYPSIVNSFDLGEIISIDKDGFMQTTSLTRISNIQQ